MARVVLTIPVPDAAVLAATYDRIVVYRSMSGRPETFREVTGPATRLPLVAGQVAYRYVDEAGDAVAWYSTAFFSTRTNALSPTSPPAQPGGDAALSILGVQELKDRALFGLPLTNAKGQELPDTFFAFYIRSAIAYCETRLDLCLTPRVVQAEQHDYYRTRSGSKPVMLSLFKAPVQAVQEIRFRPPLATLARVIEARYTSVGRDTGLVSIYAPILGAPLAATYSYLDAPFYQGDCLDNAFEVDYTAGYAVGQVPADIQEVVLMASSLAPLGVLKDLVVEPGVAFTNISGDGFGESISATNAYDKRLDTYARQMDSRLSALKLAYRGVSMVGT